MEKSGKKKKREDWEYKKTVNNVLEDMYAKFAQYPPAMPASPKPSAVRETTQKDVDDTDFSIQLWLVTASRSEKTYKIFLDKGAALKYIKGGGFDSATIGTYTLSGIKRYRKTYVEEEV